ncbi:MAG: Uncharacterized protein XD54_2060, partial [Thermococcus sibiricus]
MYALIYGKNPKLSEAEFWAFVRRFGLKVSVVESSKDWIVFESDKSIERLFHKLGGSLKLIKIVGEGEEAIKDLEYAKLFTVSLYGKSDWKLWRKLGSE